MTSAAASWAWDDPRWGHDEDIIRSAAVALRERQIARADELLSRRRSRLGPSRRLPNSSRYTNEPDLPDQFADWPTWEDHERFLSVLRVRSNSAVRVPVQRKPRTAKRGLDELRHFVCAECGRETLRTSGHCPRPPTERGRMVLGQEKCLDCLHFPGWSNPELVIETTNPVTLKYLKEDERRARAAERRKAKTRLVPQRPRGVAEDENDHDALTAITDGMSRTTELDKLLAQPPEPPDVWREGLSGKDAMTRPHDIMEAIALIEGYGAPGQRADVSILEPEGNGRLRWNTKDVEDNRQDARIRKLESAAARIVSLTPEQAARNPEDAFLSGLVKGLQAGDLSARETFLVLARDFEGDDKEAFYKRIRALNKYLSGSKIPEKGWKATPYSTSPSAERKRRQRARNQGDGATA